MKKIKSLIPLLFISLVLTGCNVNGGASVPVSATDNGTESFSSSAVWATSSSNDTSVSSVVSENNESKQPVESEPIPEKTEVTREDFQIAACEIWQWGYFCYGLHPDADSTYCPPLVDLSQSVTAEVTRDGSAETYTETFYKLISSRFAWEEDLIGKDGSNRGNINGMFSKNFQEQFWKSPGAKGITIKDGGVYVAPVSRGNINEIKTVKLDLKLNDDKSFLATITYEPENGETEIYHATFDATEPKFGSVLKNLDSVDEKGMTALPRLFTGNVEVVSEQFDFAEITDNDYKRLPTREELGEILSLLRCYDDWQYGIFGAGHSYNIPYPTSFFYDLEQTYVPYEEEGEKAEELGSYMRDTYYKGVKSPLSSEKEFNELLDTMMTENFKKAFCAYNTVFLIRDGNVYLNDSGAVLNRGVGKSWLELNSMGFTDDNTVIMKFTDVGDKEEWGIEKDIRDEFTVQLVKGSDGKLRFDETDNYNRLAYGLTFYIGMFYGNSFFLY